MEASYEKYLALVEVGLDFGALRKSFLLHPSSLPLPAVLCPLSISTL